MRMTPVSSKALSGVGYDAASKTLRLKFKSGRIHDYTDVGPEEADGLMNAESLGAHFNTHFQGRDHVRIK